ncbi:DNA polymerase II [Bermanella sp. R86510]|uniref:DNA polymerase II n=1 Tax=unclassified Bermanella TaxID=2627862 RepID=UPI0037C52F2E
MNGFILSEHWFDHSEGMTLRFWLATELGPVCIDYPQQESVCFCAQSDISQLPDWPKIRVQKLPLYHFSGSPVAAVYCQSYAILKRLRRYARDVNLNLWEADIKPTSRFLMERGLKGSLQINSEYQPYLVNPKVKPTQYQPKLSILSLDIETTMPTKKVAEKLLSIAFVLQDSNTEKASKKLVYMLGKDGEKPPKHTRYFKNVQQLLSATNALIKSWDPDIITGWNLVNFDLTVLNRLYQEHKLNMSWGRDQSDIQLKQGQNNFTFVELAGRSIVDGIDALKNASYHFDSFSLDFVSKKLLGEGKVLKGYDGPMQDRGHAITHMFKHDKEAFADYNLKDCELVLDIFSQTQIIEYLVKRSFLTGHLLDRVGGSVAAFEFLYLPKLHRAGYIAPNLGEGFDGFKAPGGLVLESQPGLYNDVLVLDFKSLYPSIIRTFKIDPMGLIEGLKANKNKQTEDTIPGFHDAHYHRTRHFLPDIIEYLWSQRDIAKKHDDQATSHAIKIIMNSFYGILGSTGCRFFDARLASSITERGHEIIQKSAQWIEQHGYHVIYGDTDSVFVSLHPDKVTTQPIATADAQEIGQFLQHGLNQFWQAHLKEVFNLECHLEIEFETHYQSFLMPTIRGQEQGSKKRYAGLLANGDLVFKGLEAVRSDWTELAKEAQTELYRAVFEGREYETLIQTIIAELLSGKRDAQLVYRKRIRKPLSSYQKNVPPQIQAALAAGHYYDQKNLNNPYAHGGWIRYVITTQGPIAVECLGMAQFKLDYEHYIDKQIAPVVDSVLYFLGKQFAQIRSPQQDIFS